MKAPYRVEGSQKLYRAENNLSISKIKRTREVINQEDRDLISKSPIDTFRAME